MSLTPTNAHTRSLQCQRRILGAGTPGAGVIHERHVIQKSVRGRVQTAKSVGRGHGIATVAASRAHTCPAGRRAGAAASAGVDTRHCSGLTTGVDRSQPTTSRTCLNTEIGIARRDTASATAKGKITDALVRLATLGCATVATASRRMHDAADVGGGENAAIGRKPKAEGFVGFRTRRWSLRIFVLRARSRHEGDKGNGKSKCRERSALYPVNLRFKHLRRVGTRSRLRNLCHANSGSPARTCNRKGVALSRCNPLCASMPAGRQEYVARLGQRCYACLHDHIFDFCRLSQRIGAGHG